MSNNDRNRYYQRPQMNEFYSFDQFNAVYYGGGPPHDPRYGYNRQPLQPAEFIPQNSHPYVEGFDYSYSNLQNGTGAAQPRYPSRGRSSRSSRGRGSRNNARNYSRPREPRNQGESFDEYLQKRFSGDSKKQSDPSSECTTVTSPEDVPVVDLNDVAVSSESPSQPSLEMINQRDALEKQLSGGTYECMICYNTIRRQVAVWSCNNCYHVFHLFCIKKWSQSMKIGVAPISPIAEELARNGHKVWRCPACQKEYTAPTFTYMCFCGKRKEPEHSTQVTPHSCGEICEKPRGENCPHKCLLPCHPGPCPPCESFTQRSCQCGKLSMTSKCGSSAPVNCGQVCERLKNCGLHSCAAECHSGACDDCEVEFDQKCQCGAETRTVVCGSPESKETSFSCGSPCKRQLTCGHHNCTQRCHPGDCPQCPRDPVLVVTCPCGRVPIGDLQADGPRKSCLDPIPVCSSASTCGRQLSCAHQCPERCHDGTCPPCAQKRTISCRCGKSSKEVSCKEWDPGKAGEFLCPRRCRKKKTCGRCRCNNTCCIDFDHVCTSVCGKTLSCGKHTCEMTCHLSHCKPCERIEMTEVACECGAVVLPPPVPCGTPRPDCSRPCTREHPCEHPVRHRCHAEASCPPCTVLVMKPCLGGHTMRTNIPCHQRSVTCGQVCNLPIAGCPHRCVRLCHEGSCVPDGDTCRQPCNTPREECGHPCQAPCHVGERCPGGQCQQSVRVNCACGLRKKVVSCYSLTTMNKWELWGALQGSQSSSASIDVDQLSRKTRQLECDNLCLQVERNRVLAEALNIDNADPMPTLGPPSYSRWLRDFARANFDFANNVEKHLDELMRTTKESKHKCRSHSFRPMNRDKRRFVHELAEFYMCDTQSYDAEPNRSVVVTGKKDRSRPPSVRLSSVVQEEINASAKLSGRRLNTNYVIRPPAPSCSSSSSFQVLGKVPPGSKREIDYFSD